MKKFITIILIAFMALSLSACSVDNTPDYNANKVNEESKTKSEINLDECYVCSVVFDDTLYDDSDFYSHNNTTVFNDGQGYIKGYYIQGDVIYEYDVAYLQFDLSSNQYKVYEWEGNYKVVEYHGVNKCIVRRWDYLLHEGCLGVFTWGELKKCIEEYNSAQKG